MPRALLPISVLIWALFWAPLAALAQDAQPAIKLIVFDLSQSCGVRTWEVEKALRKALTDGNIELAQGSSDYTLFIEIQAMPLVISPGCSGRVGLRFTEASVGASQLLAEGTRSQILLWEDSTLLHSQSSFNREAVTALQRQTSKFIAWFRNPK